MTEKNQSIQSTCPYCGVGCQVELKVYKDRIIYVDAPFGIAPNFGRLCAKGRFGIDFVHHPSRLTQPLIRKELGAKPRKPINIRGFRQASWEEALNLAAEQVAKVIKSHGGDALGTFCSAFPEALNIF